MRSPLCSFLLDAIINVHPSSYTSDIRPWNHIRFSRNSLSKNERDSPAAKLKDGEKRFRRTMRFIPIDLVRANKFHFSTKIILTIVCRRHRNVIITRMRLYIARYQKKGQKHVRRRDASSYVAWMFARILDVARFGKRGISRPSLCSFLRA